MKQLISSLNRAPVRQRDLLTGGCSYFMIAAAARVIGGLIRRREIGEIGT